MEQLGLKKIYDFHKFNTPDALAASFSSQVAAALSIAIQERGHAVLAVSGGHTPKLFFQHLSMADIAWEHIIITLVDERFIPVDNERSNEKLVREYLLQNFSVKACFVGLYVGEKTVELAAVLAAHKIHALPMPFDVVILGMGDDGHTASFFPGGDSLRLAINCNTRALVVPMHVKGLGEPRLTLTLPLLTKARFIALHIEGKVKLTSFEQALQKGPEADMPIRAVLDHAETPVQVFWSSAQSRNRKNFDSVEVCDGPYSDSASSNSKDS
ncbi:MAG: 6-phosphogluconolactonase [Candidatus Tokpelaia sp. JSC085]|nr:MAG: 6-phosphogluconolactonase [Candidatus Tokpelaia sp. JSC085]